MCDVNKEETEEVSLSDLPMEQIAEEKIEKLAMAFQNKIRTLADDLRDALEGGVYEKGEKALKEIREELNSGDIASLANSKHKILTELEKGGKVENSQTPSQHRNFLMVSNFLKAYRSTSHIIIDFNNVLALMQSGAMECSFDHNLFVVYLELVNVTPELRHELCNVYRDFEALVEEYKNIDIEDEDFARNVFGKYEEEYDKASKYLDRKMSQEHPDAYKYLDPFKTHSVNENLAKMKSIDSWTSKYADMQKKISLLEESKNALKQLSVDVQKAYELYKNSSFEPVVNGYFDILRNIDIGIRDSLKIIDAIKNGSNDSPYWIMKYESNIISTKGKFALGHSKDPMKSGTDYYYSFNDMNNYLKKIIGTTLVTKFSDRHWNQGIFR